MTDSLSRVARWFSLLALALAMSLSSTEILAAPPSQSDSTLTIAAPAPGDLDPTQRSRFDALPRDLVENLFVGLTRFDPVTHQIEPMLAESWAVSQDGLTWTFTLRQDIFWMRYDPATQQAETVRPVAAGDIVYAIQRACDPLRPSPLTANLMIISGCHTVANAFPEVISDLFIAREIGVRATGPATLEIDLVFPASYFPALLSTPELRPLPREAITVADHWTAAETIMTNGPYVLQRWDLTGITLGRNPTWPDPYTGNIEHVEVVFTDTIATAAARVAEGHASFARLSPDNVTANLAAHPDMVHVVEGPSLTLLGFSYEYGLVATPEVRRALALALDRDALSAQIPGTLPQNGFTPPGMIAAPDHTAAGWDPSAAQAAFTAAGFPGCDGVPERLTLMVPNDDPAWLQLGQAIVSQWTATLGCNPALFEVVAVPRVQLIKLSHANYDPEQITRPLLWLVNWSADYPDANAWLNDALHCRYGYLRTDRACDSADTLLDQAAAEQEPAARTALYAQVEEQWFGAAGTFPVIPLFISADAWMQQPTLSNVNAYGAARYDLWNLES